MKTYQDLIVWNKAMDFASEIYRFVPLLPKDELYGLFAQLQRAAVSIPANIAEGYGRHSTGDYLKHLRYAIASD